MDNSNANNGGFSPVFPGGQNNQGPSNDQNPQFAKTDTSDQQDKKHSLDFIIRPKNSNANLVNARTQSMIESPRDAYQNDLARAAAYEAQMREAYRQQQMKEKAKKTGLYVALSIFGLIFLVALVFMLIAIANNSGGRIPEKPQASGNSTEPGASVISGYNCKSKDCRLMNELPDGRLLIRDNGGFYLFDKTSDKPPVLTSIENKEYSSITSFAWGSRLLAVLAPTTESKALYSISENRLITQYEYSKFYIDFTDKSVYDSTAVTQEVYIVAKKDAPQQYSLIDLRTGNEVVRGAEGIYTDGVFYFSYEGGRNMRVFSEGSAEPFVTSNTASFFTRNGVLLVITPSGGGGYRLGYYNKFGERMNTSEIPFFDEIKQLDNRALLETLRSNNKYLEIPIK